jgi:peptidyl-prolyl cis-trans isomerase C
MGKRMQRHNAGLRWFHVVVVFGVLAGCTSKPKEAGGAPEGTPAPQLKNGLTEAQSNKVLAKVGDTVITVGQFADRLGAQSPYLRTRYASPERRREFLDTMVRFELLALEAKKRGLDKDAEVERVRRQTMVQQMMKETFDENGVKLSDISDQEIQAYYDAHPTEFHKPEQRRASQIVFKDRGKADAALKKLQASPDMELFVKTAKEQNQDPETKDRDGDLRFFSREPTAGDEGPAKEIREAVFSLKESGNLAPQVVETPQGFHVLKYTGERPALERSVQDARRLIQNRLWRQKREEAIEKFVADLRAKADVKESPELLSQVKIEVSEGPAGSPKPSSGGPKPGVIAAGKKK